MYRITENEEFGGFFIFIIYLAALGLHCSMWDLVL